MKINTIKMNVRRYIEIAFWGFFVGGGDAKNIMKKFTFVKNQEK